VIYNINSIGANKLNILLSKQQQVYLVDVREPMEYKQGRIKGSINIPLSCILNEIDKFDIGKKLVMICKVGIRSKLACEKLLSEGYDFDLLNLDGGMLAWEAAGYKIEK
jgi:adenylyltransferase/sulfurtransferase